MYKKWTRASVVGLRNVSITAQAITAPFVKSTLATRVIAMRKAAPVVIALNARLSELTILSSWIAPAARKSKAQLSWIATLCVALSLIFPQRRHRRQFTKTQFSIHWTIVKIHECYAFNSHPFGQFTIKGACRSLFFVKIYRIDNFLSIYSKTLAFSVFLLYNEIIL